MARGETMNKLLKKFKIELVYNHAIYFQKLEDSAFGILAEDTNYMIRNYGKIGYENIKLDSIEENIELLKKIITKEEV